MRHLIFERQQEIEVHRVSGNDECLHPVQRVLALIAGEILAGARDREADICREAVIRVARGTYKGRRALFPAIASEAAEEHGFSDNVGLDRGGLAATAESIGHALGSHPRASGELHPKFAFFHLGDGDQVCQRQTTACRHDARQMSQQLARFGRGELADAVQLAVGQTEGEIGASQGKGVRDVAGNARDQCRHHQVERVLPLRVGETLVEERVRAGLRQRVLRPQLAEGGLQNLAPHVEAAQRRDALGLRRVQEFGDAAAGAGGVRHLTQPAGSGVRLAFQQQDTQRRAVRAIGQAPQPLLEWRGESRGVVHDGQGRTVPAALAGVLEPRLAQEAGVPARAAELLQ